jgi:predicted ATPase
MLNRLRLRNFRSHADTEILFQPLHLLVGPAGAGKSNLFKALVLLQNSMHRKLDELFPPGIGEFRWVRSRWAGETDPITFEVDISEVEEFPGNFRYQLSIADAPNGLYVVNETLEHEAGPGEGYEYVFQRRSKPRQMGEFGQVNPHDPTLLHKVLHGSLSRNEMTNIKKASAVARTLSKVGYYHLEVSELKSLGSGEFSNRISYYGGRLPDFLAWLKATPEQNGAYEQIEKGLNDLLPNFKSIVVTQVGPETQGMALSFVGHQGWITAPDLSDGTLLTLGLLCILHGPNRPSLLCLEEPETGLHPRRLRWLFERMATLAYPLEGQKRTQIILTTHSADLFDLFRDMPESVHVIDQQTQIDGIHSSRITPLPIILEKLHKDPNISVGHAWATGLYENL